jgi:hypothetical protein
LFDLNQVAKRADLDPVGDTNLFATLTTEGGAKFDGAKIDWTILPWQPLEDVVAVLEFGAKKYARDSWQTVPNGRVRYVRAAFRHLVSHALGEVNDPESGLPHLAHAACSVLFALGSKT